MCVLDYAPLWWLYRGWSGWQWPQSEMLGPNSCSCYLIPQIWPFCRWPSGGVPPGQPPSSVAWLFMRQTSCFCSIMCVECGPQCEERNKFMFCFVCFFVFFLGGGFPCAPLPPYTKSCESRPLIYMCIQSPPPVVYVAVTDGKWTFVRLSQA